MIKLKIFEQTKTGYCGPAALKMVFDYYGLKATEKQIARRSSTTVKNGTTQADMIKAVKSFGWHGFWKENATIQDLKFFLKQDKAVIVDWFSLYGDHYEGHYSVVASLDKEYIYLADPEIGKIRKIFIQAFKKVWFDFEGPQLKNAKKLYFEWMLVPTPNKEKSKIKGNYF